MISSCTPTETPLLRVRFGESVSETCAELNTGYRRVRITPHLGHLQWAEGSYPTPYGVITVSHERMNDGTIRSDIKTPKGVKVVK